MTPRAALIPKRKLARDRGVLIDHGLDLERAQDQALLGQLEDEQIAVMGGVRARRHPCDHVVAIDRGHRCHQHELEPPLARQAKQDIVRHHGNDLAAVLLPRHGPEILVVV